MKKTGLGLQLTMRKSDGARADHEKRSDWVRDDHEKMSDMLRVNHEK